MSTSALSGPRASLVAITLISIAVVAQVLFAIGAQAPSLFDDIAHTLSVYPETLALLVFVAALVAPPILLYLSLVAFSRGLSRKAPALIAITALVPTCFFTLGLQLLISLLT